MRKYLPRFIYKRKRLCVFPFLFSIIYLIAKIMWGTNCEYTLYKYYTRNGIVTGLQDTQPYFTLNGRRITLYSGSIHYFRVPPAAWRDRLRKARAAGLNTVSTYVPWNLHEPEPGVFEWGTGESGSDFAKFLNLEQFLKIAQEEDLFVIVRPGPYICAEWDFGGLPAWLLRERNIKVRTSDEKFMKHVRRYFKELLSLLAKLQFSNGGPIIAFQVENEYASTFSEDKDYLYSLKKLMDMNGIVELLFTSDNVMYDYRGAIPGVLQTINFHYYPQIFLTKLLKLQPGKPLMVMEYWSGWFNHWSEKHYYIKSVKTYAEFLRKILEYPASVNLYMFHGGTNWGFLNGANLEYGSGNKGYLPDTTSYDYDAPLTEAGDYTDKYNRTRDVIESLNFYKNCNIHLPPLPPLVRRIAYQSVYVTEKLPFQDFVLQVDDNVRSLHLKPMEVLSINNNGGQQYGYIVYRKTNINIPPNSVLKISEQVCDTVMVLLNGNLISKPLQNNTDINGFGYWILKNSTLNLGPNAYQGATLDLVVGNMGRNNFGHLDQFIQFKGLWQGPVFINERELFEWDIIPLEFRTKWTNALGGWKTYEKSNNPVGPALYRASLIIDKPRDTYIDMREWTMGIVIVNGFVLGRHAIIGPQYSLYLPGSFLNEGENVIIVFEHFKAPSHIRFVVNPIINRNFVIRYII